MNLKHLKIALIIIINDLFFKVHNCDAYLGQEANAGTVSVGNNTGEPDLTTEAKVNSSNIRVL